MEIGDHKEVLRHAAESGDAPAEGSAQAVEGKKVDLPVGSLDLAPIGEQSESTSESYSLQ